MTSLSPDSSAPPPLSVPTLRPINVLLIDDDYDIRDAMTEILESDGLTVCTATHGREALELLQWYRPELILLDLNMPVMSGAEFRDAQRRVPELYAIPTIVLTAVDRMHDRLVPIAPTAALAKPIRLADLMTLVRQYCTKTPL